MLSKRLTTAERPLLFLDIDGVLNTMNRDHEPIILGGCYCWIPPGTRERVHRLIEVYDPVWCTAWLGRAHSAWRDYLGLDPIPWPYVNYRQYKLVELIRMAGERRWAYVDDDAFTYELRGLDWTPDMVDGLVIQPDHNTGLTDEHVEELLAYAQEGVPA